MKAIERSDQRESVNALLYEIRMLADSPVLFMLYTAYLTLKETEHMLKLSYEALKKNGEDTSEVERLMEKNEELEEGVVKALKEREDVELVAKLLEPEKEEAEDGRVKTNARRAR